MSWTLLERAKEAADLVRAELNAHCLTCRETADWLGIPKSTLSDFLNFRNTTRGVQQVTLDKLLTVEGWKPETRQALEALRPHGKHTLLSKFGPSAAERSGPSIH